MKIEGKIKNIQYRYYRVSHAIRLTMAFLCCLLIFSKIKTIEDVSWIFITLVVIMGPMSYKGSVYPRAIQRVLGTLIGIFFSIASFYIGKYNAFLALIPIAMGIFTCGYLVLSKVPYAAILIGISLSVVVTATEGNLDIALWRISDIFIGCLIAVIFSSIFPHKASIHWDIELFKLISNLHLLYAANLSRNIFTKLDLRRLNIKNKKIVADIIKLSGPAQKETKVDKSVYASVQACIQDLTSYLVLIEMAYWECEVSHKIINRTSLSAQVNNAIQYRFVMLESFIRDNIRDTEGMKKFHYREFKDEVMLELKKITCNQPENAQQQDLAVENQIYGYFYLGMKIIDRLDTLIELLYAMKDECENKHFHLIPHKGQ
ncbi:FUSC family protein [Brenneria sp. g21c3]|uniref:FUSC family protein n=1 Tax=Brenneria sp. g21c3 TaxID=3093893 RepID=UPI002EC2FFEC|nr:FUSC family protein [Brenneria sp. g21c3]